MEKYLLNSEYAYLKVIIDILNKYLPKPISPLLQRKTTKIIKDNKDGDIDDYLNGFANLLIEEISPILKNNITPGLQIGIKNKYFQIESHGGYYITENKLKKVQSETQFSLDSISKVITSIITIQFLRDSNFDLNTPINKIDTNYTLSTSIESILKFTSCIRTDKRLDNLNREETISLLKNCKELLEEKKHYNNFFEYNDVGFMILRQIIPNFKEKLDILLKNTNITYDNSNKKNITGGKRNEENFTPDTKGRDIIFPGHTGLYSNITSIIDFFNDLINTEKILTSDEKELLWKQPYIIPYSYNLLTNQQKCINKIAGIYKLPHNLFPNYDKLKTFDMPSNTTNESISSTGTCGSWIINDNLFNNYTAGILTNPYTYVNNSPYPNEINDLENTELKVSQKGKIQNYSRLLNPYKEILVNYSIILDLLTEYIKGYNRNIKPKTLKKEIKLPN